jgi:serine/threonine-protein kinase
MTPAPGHGGIDAALRSLREGITGSALADALRCGPYTLVGAIGAGAVADVFAAQRDGGRAPRHAVKLVRPGVDGQETIARFAREQEILAAVRHPNVVNVVDCGIHASGLPWFAMPLVDGGPITVEADRRHMTVEERFGLARQAFEAVAALHARMIVHRDVKPGNLLVEGPESRPQVRLVDCGIARAMGARGKRLTPVGGVHRLGTPEYMSPEQWADGVAACDARADVFALGIVLGQLACGTVPRSSRPAAGGGGERRRRAPGPPCAPSAAFVRWMSADPEAATAAMRARGRRSAERFAEELRARVDPAVLALTETDPARRPGDARAAAAVLG